MDYKELRKNRHILYHLYLEKKKTYREDFFFTDKEKFQVFRKVTTLAISRLK